MNKQLLEEKLKSGKHVVFFNGWKVSHMDKLWFYTEQDSEGGMMQCSNSFEFMTAETWCNFEIYVREI
jgi:hypothetical protein